MPELTFSSDKWALLLPAILMCLDIVVGFTKALKEKNLKSSVMTNGLYKKSGEICLIVIAMIVTVALSIPIKIAYGISMYVSVTELISIFQNLNSLGVSIPKWFSSLFKGGDNNV